MAENENLHDNTKHVANDDVRGVETDGCSCTAERMKPASRRTTQGEGWVGKGDNGIDGGEATSAQKLIKVKGVGKIPDGSTTQRLPHLSKHQLPT